MRYLSVCAGVCAATLGWRDIGWSAAGFSEIEGFPRAVLEQRHGAVAVDWNHRYSSGSNITPLLGDFTKIEEHHVGPIDLLVGGTPCQSFSIAGKRAGLDDPRGNLTLEFLALAKRLRPKWIVWENVPGALSHDKGRTLGTILKILGELGYGWSYRVLDAQYVRVGMFSRAVPQRRRRLFVVGCFGNPAGAAAVLLDRESMSGNPAPRREAGQGIASTVEASTGGCSGKDGIEGQVIASDVSPTLNAGGSMPPGTSVDTADMLVAFGGGNTSGSIDVSTACNAHGVRLDFDSETLIAFSSKDYGNGAAVNVSPTLRAMNSTPGNENGGGQMAVAFDTTHITSPTNASRVVAGAPCHTLSASAHIPSVAISNSSSSLTSWAVRRLTPRECERLQGFPDDFTLINWRGKPATDTPRYKAIGNSMAVNVMAWIGERIALVDRVLKEREG